jgi:AcrR family transcriptional regulator
MPRVLADYKEQVRKRIVEEAVRQFTKNGYYNTRMDDIGEGLGVTKGAIYKYYKTKEQLFIVALESIFAQRAQIIYSILDSGDLSYLATNEFFDQMIAKPLESGLLTQDLIVEAFRNKNLKKKLVGIYQKEGGDLFEKFENLKTKLGISPSTDVQSLYLGIIALRDGLVSNMLLGTDVTIAKKAWTTITKLVLDIIQGNKSL